MVLNEQTKFLTRYISILAILSVLLISRLKAADTSSAPPAVPANPISLVSNLARKDLKLALGFVKGRLERCISEPKDTEIQKKCIAMVSELYKAAVGSKKQSEVLEQLAPLLKRFFETKDDAIINSRIWISGINFSSDTKTKVENRNFFFAIKRAAHFKDSDLFSQKLCTQSLFLGDFASIPRAASFHNLELASDSTTFDTTLNCLIFSHLLTDRFETLNTSLVPLFSKNFESKLIGKSLKYFSTAKYILNSSGGSFASSFKNSKIRPDALDPLKIIENNLRQRKCEAAASALSASQQSTSAETLYLNLASAACKSDSKSLSSAAEKYQSSLLQTLRNPPLGITTTYEFIDLLEFSIFSIAHGLKISQEITDFIRKSSNSMTEPPSGLQALVSMFNKTISDPGRTNLKEEMKKMKSAFYKDYLLLLQFL